MSDSSRIINEHIYSEMKQVFSGDMPVKEPKLKDVAIGQFLDSYLHKFRALGVDDNRIRVVAGIALLHANGTVIRPEGA